MEIGRDSGHIGMFRFAGHTLDVARSCVRTGDREINLRPKSYEVLRYLVENAERLVTKEEMIKAIWPNVVATDESLAQCISEVRRAIGDTRQGIIKTVPRRGYKLAASVQRLPTKVQRLPTNQTAGSESASSEGPQLIERSTTRRNWPPLPDCPSVAVLPFENMSGDAGQEYFADGVAEEIITALSRFSGLFVIARNSSFTYKGRAVDVKQVGRDLGVRYVLEGSVRKTAHRVRITGQLVDAANGGHLWADRFDGALDDVLDLQDHVAASVVSAIAPKLEQAEIERAKSKPTDRLDAYDYFLRGMEYAYQDTRETVDEALRLFLRAIELDPAFARAHAMAAYCYVLRKASRWTEDKTCEVNEAARLARRATQLNKQDAAVLSRAGHTLAYVVEEFDSATFLIDRAITLNQNLASTWFSSGCLRYWLGYPDLAIKHMANFKRMSPLDPLMPVAQSVSAFSHLFTDRYDKALSEAELALQEAPNLHFALRSFATASALAGKIGQAQEAMARLLRIDPTLRICNLKDQTPLRRPEDMARYAEGMRKAGLPE